MRPRSYEWREERQKGKLGTRPLTNARTLPPPCRPASRPQRRLQSMPLRHLLHQLRPQRITFHIPQHPQQMLVGLHHEILKPPLIHMPAPHRLVRHLPPRGVPKTQRPKKPPQIPILARANHKMPVIPHDAPGEHRHRQPLMRLHERPLKRQKIPLCLNCFRQHTQRIEGRVRGCGRGPDLEALFPALQRCDRKNRNSGDKDGIRNLKRIV